MSQSFFMGAEGSTGEKSVVSVICNGVENSLKGDVSRGNFRLAAAARLWPFESRLPAKSGCRHASPYRDTGQFLREHVMTQSLGLIGTHPRSFSSLCLSDQ